MSAPLWLARRELAARRGRAAFAALVVAGASALVTATEVLARGREEAIAAQVDALGAPVRILPRGVSREAIASYDLRGATLPADAEARVRSALGRDLRALEARRAVAADVEGSVIPVVAASSGARRVEPGTAAVGSVAAAPLHDLPATATIDDTVVHVSAQTIERLGAASAPGELRVFLAPGANVRAATDRLSAAFPDAQVIRADRGEVADGEMDGALAGHRLAVYVVTAAIGALFLLIAAHLDGAERRTELATLVAVGATRAALAGMVLARSVLLAIAGASGGIAMGLGLAAALGPGPPTALLRAAGTAASVLGGAISVAAFAALPPALAAAARDPVPELQDG